MKTPEDEAFEEIERIQRTRTKWVPVTPTTAQAADGRKAGGGGMKEEWLFPNAVVPVDVETTAALVAEIKRLIEVVGGLVLKQGPDYERGVVDGMQKQMQSSVDKAVNAMAQPKQGEPVTKTLRARGKQA
jgi:hypothetical protein